MRLKALEDDVMRHDRILFGVDGEGGLVTQLALLTDSTKRIAYWIRWVVGIGGGWLAVGLLDLLKGK